MQVKCPTCKRGVDWNETSTFRPFCSNRCRLIDLGAWFSEEHAVPGDPVAPDDDASRPADSSDS